MTVDRYARHGLIPGWDQDRLAAAHVVVAGAGAVGNEAAKNLALLGVGRLTLVDMDVVETTNLARSVLFRAEDAGRPKAEVAARAAMGLNPDVRAEAVVGDLEFDLPFRTLREADVVLGCLDSVHARLVLNRLCLAAGTPWANAGISHLAAEVAVYAPGETACFECAVGDAGEAEARRRFSCGGLRSLLPDRTVPTTATTASLAGGLAVQQALHRLTGAGGLAPGHRAFVSLDPFESWTVELPRDPGCPCHDAPYRVRPLPCPEGWRLTATDLLARLGADRVVLGAEYLAGVRCAACGDETALGLPTGRVSADVLDCARCGTGTRVPARVRALGPHGLLADLPLARLGLGEGHLLAVETGGRIDRYEL